MGRLMRKCISVILAALICMTMMAPAFAESAYFVRNAKIYSKKSTSSASVTVPKGTKCTILSVDGNWAKVRRGNMTAYMNVGELNLTNRVRAYANRDTYIFAAPTVNSAKNKIGVNTEMYIVGRYSDFWRVQTKNGGVTAYIKMAHTASSKVNDNWKDKVVAMDWYKGGSSVLDRGDYGYLYDCATGIQIRVKRMGGHNHADLEPATAEDTAKLLKMCGGEFNWDSRAVILHSEGKFVACAINTMPHGDQTIHNNCYNGQFCLHMVNSRTHGSDSINSAHQKAIKAAYSWAH